MVIEERSDGLLEVEIKSQTGRGEIPTTFTKAYPEADTMLVSPDNRRELVYADTGTGGIGSPSRPGWRLA